MSEHTSHGEALFYGGPHDGAHMRVMLCPWYLFTYALPPGETEIAKAVLWSAYQEVDNPVPPVRYEFRGIVDRSWFASPPKIDNDSEVLTDEDDAQQ